MIVNGTGQSKTSEGAFLAEITLRFLLYLAAYSKRGEIYTRIPDMVQRGADLCCAVKFFGSASSKYYLTLNWVGRNCRILIGIMNGFMLVQREGLRQTADALPRFPSLLLLR